MLLSYLLANELGLTVLCQGYEIRPYGDINPAQADISAGCLELQSHARAGVHRKDFAQEQRLFVDSATIDQS